MPLEFLSHKLLEQQSDICFQVRQRLSSYAYSYTIYLPGLEKRNQHKSKQQLQKKKKIWCAFSVNVLESIPLSKQEKVVDYMGGINHNHKYVSFIVRDIWQWLNRFLSLHQRKYEQKILWRAWKLYGNELNVYFPLNQSTYFLSPASIFF